MLLPWLAALVSTPPLWLQRATPPCRGGYRLAGAGALPSRGLSHHGAHEKQDTDNRLEMLPPGRRRWFRLRRFGATQLHLGGWLPAVGAGAFTEPWPQPHPGLAGEGRSGQPAFEMLPPGRRWSRLRRLAAMQLRLRRPSAGLAGAFAGAWPQPSRVWLRRELPGQPAFGLPCLAALVSTGRFGHMCNLPLGAAPAGSGPNLYRSSLSHHGFGGSRVTDNCFEMLPPESAALVSTPWLA
jgi:hypothetical protein